MTRRSLTRTTAAGTGLLVLVLAVAACSSSAGGGAGSPGSAGGARNATAPQPAAPPAEKADGGTGQAAPSAQPGGGGSMSAQQVDALSGRDVIRTAETTVRVAHVLSASARVEALAAADLGYVAGEQTDAEPDHPDRAQAVLTIRVPATRLAHLLLQLESLGTLVSEQQSSQDVTSQVVDVQARLATQRASVARVRALLARATTLGDVVRIEGELAQREAALESLEAQSKALADQTSLATVTATLVGPTAPAAKPKPVEASGFGTGLRQGWHAFTVATTWLLTAVGALLPFAILFGLLAGGAWLVVRRRRTPVVLPEPTEPTAA